ncbi:MAG: acyltransferase family protein [Duncaniella sp.]|nr:acyltransferase family protein [Duncaniella sp.]
MKSSTRYYTIDIAKAIAIVLVAIGHFEVEPMPEFYKDLHTVIYTFHMPLFMFASGFLCIATWRSLSYGSFLGKKFRRLMIPYFVTSVIIISIKLLTQSAMPVDNPVSAADFISMLWLPKAGFFLWFVYALWWMMVIIPFFNTPARRLLLLALSIPAYFCCDYVTELFCLAQTARMGIFFVSGAVMYDMFDSRAVVKALCGVSAVIFIPMAIATLHGALEVGGFRADVLWLLTAFSGIGFAIAVSYGIETRCGISLRRALYKLAGASYIVYLFHTTFMGFAKGVLSKIGFFSAGDLLVNYTIAEILVPLLSGVFIPYLLCRYVLVRYSLSRSLFGLG